MPKLRKCHICGKNLKKDETNKPGFDDDFGKHFHVSVYRDRVYRTHFCSSCQGTIEHDIRQERNKPKNQRARERNG